MGKHMRKLEAFPAEDGHIESVLVGVQEVKVSFQDWKGRKLVIIFRGVEEFHGSDSIEQCIIGQDIGKFVIKKEENEMHEYSFLGAWDETAFLKIKGKTMEIYEVGVTNNIDSALYEIDTNYIGGNEN